MNSWHGSPFFPTPSPSFIVLVENWRERQGVLRKICGLTLNISHAEKLLTTASHGNRLSLTEFLVRMPDPHLSLGVMASTANEITGDRREHLDKLRVASAGPGAALWASPQGHTGAHQGIKRCQRWGLKKADSSVNGRYLEQHSRAAQCRAL